MKQVFLNHKTEDKTIVLAVHEHLTQCLISSWLDSEDIRGGEGLVSGIQSGIANSRYFLAFISPKYVRSSWCMHELQQAMTREIQGKTIIIPILLSPKEELEMNQLPPERKNFLEPILGGKKYITYDKYDKDKSNEEIAIEIGKHNKIRFYPITRKTVQGTEIQLIKFDISTLPTNFLQEWNLNIESDFLGDDGDQTKPLHKRKAIAFYGQGPGWLYSYLTLPFKNLCPVYVFNNRSEEYICVYDPKMPPEQLGKTLKPQG